jgi:hypothetical protein
MPITEDEMINTDASFAANLPALPKHGHQTFPEEEISFDRVSISIAIRSETPTDHLENSKMKMCCEWTTIAEAGELGATEVELGSTPFL